jgi:hypothetical protein
MARPPAYKLYSSDVPTVHADNDLQKLIALGQLLQPKTGRRYVVKDINNNVAWEGERNGN